MSIQSGFEKISEYNVSTSNYTTLELAIADLIYCENIPDHVVNWKKFNKVLK